MEANQERPAYVTFEYRTLEDRDATLNEGHFVGKEVAYAVITPIGSKDKIERVAEEWLVQLRQQVNEGRFRQDWLDGYKSIFKEWKEGREIPENGTPILTWPAISALQQKMILDANIRTVEDLALANESALNSLGMGARALKEKARYWLETAKDVGAVAGKFEALEAKNEQLTASNAALEKKISKLEALVNSKSVKEDA